MMNVYVLTGKLYLHYDYTKIIYHSFIHSFNNSAYLPFTRRWESWKDTILALRKADPTTGEHGNNCNILGQISQ